MTDRGEYRAIRRVLLDGKDFRKLPERARFVFLALKLNIGPSGLETFEPDALVYTLAAQTGAKPDQIRVSLDLLELHGWLKREDNVVWVVGQLTHDPHVKPTDPKHRKGVQRHVAGLPRLAIVREFIESHPSWFEDMQGPTEGLPSRAETSLHPIEGPSEGLARAIEGPSKGHRSTEDKREPENKPEPEAPAGAASGGRTALTFAVEQVVAHRKSLAPSSRPDDKQRKQIKTALGWGYDAADLCIALSGAYGDAWCQKTGNHGILYVLRDSETIDKYISRGAVAAKAHADASDPSSPGYIGAVNGVPSEALIRLTS